MCQTSKFFFCKFKNGIKKLLNMANKFQKVILLKVIENDTYPTTSNAMLNLREIEVEKAADRATQGTEAIEISKGNIIHFI